MAEACPIGLSLLSQSLGTNICFDVSDGRLTNVFEKASTQSHTPKMDGHDEKQCIDVETTATTFENTIDPAAEKRLVRKLDLWLSPMMVVVFLVAYLDRSNIGEHGLAFAARFD